MNKIENFYNNILIQMGYYGPFVLLLPILIGLFYKKNHNATLKYFLSYLIAIFGSSIILLLLNWSLTLNSPFRNSLLTLFKKYQIINTHFLNILGIWIVFILLGYFFCLLLKDIYKQKIIKIIILILCIFSLINHLFIEGFRTYGIMGALSINLFTLFFSGSYLWFISHNPPNISYFKNPFIWICTALFINSLALMIFGFFADKIYNDNFILFIKYQICINILNVLSQFAFAYAFYLSKYVKYLR